MYLLASIRFAFFVLALLVASSASAWSLYNRPTDNSVCDLSPMTSYRLGLKPFVPAGTPRSDEIYERLALRQIAENCSNGQVLILHSEDGSQFDVRYFPNVAKGVCTAADVQRIPAGTADHPQAFEMRCKIVKLDQAKKYLADLEAQKSTEAMIAEGIAARSGPAKEVNIPGPGDARSDTICLGKLIGISGTCIEK